MIIRKVLTIIVIIAIAIFIANVFSMVFFLNGFIAQKPDLSCNQDSDCMLLLPDRVTCNICSGCDNYELSDDRVMSVNKNWHPYCPFQKPQASCLMCFGNLKYNGNSIEASDDAYFECVENKCQKVLP